MKHKNLLTKTCRVCGRELPIEMFNRTSSYVDGYLPFCKDCATRRWKDNEWMHHNLALESFPWPFNDDRHAMDIEAIEESIRRRNYEREHTAVVENQKRKIRHKPFEKQK